MLAWSQNLDPAAARDRGVAPVAKDELLARSDVVSLHLGSANGRAASSARAELRR